MRVFVDSSGFKAWLDERDEFHNRAGEMLKEMVEDRAELVTSNFIVDECCTLSRMRCGLKKALLLRRYLLSALPVIKILRVSVDDEKGAWNWFRKEWAGLSFTDAVTFAQMKRLGIEYFFGFDGHFEMAGFRLAVREKRA